MTTPNDTITSGYIESADGKKPLIEKNNANYG